jgi:uncharacterized membrane protein
MEPLIVLTAVFTISLIVNRIVFKKYNTVLSARIALSVMLLFTAIGHFIFTAGMMMMIPDVIPFKREVVIFTGIFEIAAAVGLHLPKYRQLTAWLLILFFIAVLPANIKAAIEQVDYRDATNIGNDITYLWFRVPLQILFIIWTYLSSIKFFDKPGER